jgi:antitoxin (DNA-binding transcriptional repressor) of toxin-antitoxin stability system
METQKVGIREFRDNLAAFVLESDRPFAITRHGETVGHYVPVRRKKPTAEQMAAFRIRTEEIQQEMVAKGVTEEDVDHVIAEFERFRKAERRARQA